MISTFFKTEFKSTLSNLKKVGPIYDGKYPFYPVAVYEFGGDAESLNSKSSNASITPADTNSIEFTANAVKVNSKQGKHLDTGFTDRNNSTYVGVFNIPSLDTTKNFFMLFGNFQTGSVADRRGWQTYISGTDKDFIFTYRDPSSSVDSKGLKFTPNLVITEGVPIFIAVTFSDDGNCTVYANHDNQDYQMTIEGSQASDYETVSIGNSSYPQSILGYEFLVNEFAIYDKELSLFDIKHIKDIVMPNYM